MNIIQDLPRPARKSDFVALDIEIYHADSERLHMPIGDFACLSICYAGEEDTVYQIINVQDLPKVMKRLEDAKYWAFHNAMFDLRHLRRWVQIDPHPVWDTMLVDRALFGGYYTTFSLADLSNRWLEEKLSKVEQSEFFDADSMTPRMSRYAALDASTTIRIQQKQAQYLEENGEDLPTYFQVDMPAIWAILDIKPVRIDRERWKKLAETFEAAKLELKATLDFNPSSPQQTKAKIEKLYRHPIPNTQAETLHDLEAQAEQKGNQSVLDLLNVIFEYREYATAASRYGFGWLEKNCTPDGYVFSAFTVSGAESGRMSSSKPNLQNIPARKHPEYRKAFIASEGCVLLDSDVASQEPRVLAHISKDSKLIDIIKSGMSIHVYVARELFHDPNLTKKDKEKYAIGKALNLGIEYGMSTKGLAYRLHIPEEDAEKYFRHYFTLFPGIQAYINKFRRDASRLGYVRTPLGRKMYINPYNSQWQNNAINSPVQGGAAEMTKLALVYMHQHHEEYGVPYSVVMVVHDEIVCDVLKQFLEKTQKLVTDAWDWAGRQTIPSIPVVVEMAVGQDWGCKSE